MTELKKSHPSAMRVMNRSELRALEEKKQRTRRLQIILAFACFFFACALVRVVIAVCQ